MDKKITDFIVTEFKIGKWMLAPIDLLLLVFAPVFSLMMRLSIISYKCMDYPAYDSISKGLKVTTGVFDILLAVIVAIFVFELTSHKLKAFLAYAITLMIPVLCASNAMWGLGDSIYVFFAVLSLYLLAKGKGNISLISYGISLFLSRYAFFLLPVYAIAYMQKKNKLLFFLFPFCGVWFRNGFMSSLESSKFPVFEAERLMSITHGNELICYNWPNLYQIIGPDKFVSEYAIVAKCITAVLMLAIVAAAILRRNELTKEKIISVALTLSLLFPFILPGMNERAGLLADILAIIFVFRYMKLYYVAIIQIIISYIAYSAYFRESSVIPLCYVAFVSLFLICVMLQFTGSGKKITGGDLHL